MLTRAHFPHDLRKVIRYFAIREQPRVEFTLDVLCKIRPVPSHHFHTGEFKGGIAVRLHQEPDVTLTCAFIFCTNTLGIRPN